MKRNKDVRPWGSIVFGAAKRAAPWIFLALIVTVSVIVPASSALAQGGTPDDWSCSTNIACQITDAAKRITRALSDAVFSLAALSARFLTWVLVDFYEVIGFIDNPFVQVGWAAVRDIANWFFIIFFLISAISTTMNLDRYNARAILPKLILMAILVNFSLFLTGFVINIANMFMYLFVTAGVVGAEDAGWTIFSGMGIPNAEPGQTIADSIDRSEKTQWNVVVIGTNILSTLFAIGAAFLFFFLSLLLISRVIYLWVSIILSPLAFVLSIFPKTSEFFDKWSKTFFDQTIFGVLAAFFIWLALYLTHYMDGVFAGGATGVPPTGSSSLPLLAQSMDGLIKYFTIFAFLFLSMKVAKDMSGAAGAALSGVMKTALLGVGVAGAVGVATKVGGVAMKGVQKAATPNLQRKAGRVMQAIPGLRRRGQRVELGADERGGERLDEHQKEAVGIKDTGRLKKMANSARGDRRAALHAELMSRGDDMSGVSDKDKGRAIKRLRKLGQLDTVLEKTDKSALTGAAKSGELGGEEQAAVHREMVKRKMGLKDVLPAGSSPGAVNKAEKSALENLISHSPKEGQEAAQAMPHIAADIGVLKGQEDLIQREMAAGKTREDAVKDTKDEGLENFFEKIRPSDFAKIIASAYEDASVTDAIGRSLTNPAVGLDATHLNAAVRNEDNDEAIPKLRIVYQGAKAAGTLPTRVEDGVDSNPVLKAALA